MDRRPLSALLALGLIALTPTVAVAASAEALLAQSSGGSLSGAPSSDLIAQAPKGSLSDTPTATGSNASPRKEASSDAASATPAALPFTGSDPRVMVALGVAALLAGAGLRLRTGDARDY